MSINEPSGDPLAEMRKWTDLLRFHEITRAASARTYLVRDPAYAAEVAAFAAAHGLDDIVTVQASPLVPEGQVYAIDEQAIDANLRAALQAWRPYRPDRPFG